MDIKNDQKCLAQIERQNKVYEEYTRGKPRESLEEILTICDAIANKARIEVTTNPALLLVQQTYGEIDVFDENMSMLNDMAHPDYIYLGLIETIKEWNDIPDECGCEEFEQELLSDNEKKRERQELDNGIAVKAYHAVLDILTAWAVKHIL